LGGETPLAVKFVVTFVVVLVLIPLFLWVVRRIGGSRLGSPASRGGRQPRLAVIDAASVDGRRKLVLIRRDNVEHLMLIGGPTDVVIEQNIVRAVPVAPPREAPPVRPPAGEAAPRAAEISPRSEPSARPAPPEATWATPPEPPVSRTPRQHEPVRGSQGEPVPRPPRSPEPAPKAPPPVDLPTRPLPEPVSAAMRAATPEPPRTPPSAKAPPQRAAEPPRSAEPPRAAEAEQPVEMRQSPPTADVNLADMAQRLEAALRRPARPAEGRDAGAKGEPKPRPTAEPPRPPASAEPLPPAPSAQPLEGEGEPPPPAAESTPAPEPAKPADAAEPKPAPAKSVFDSLEEEMANLLGRPPSKT
jgi:flagellar protein FliO/FliZ